MNSLQRVTAAIARRTADRVPVLPQVFGHAAVLAGVSLAAYVSDGETLARCQLEALARYGHDAVFAFMDTCVETEAMGSVLSYEVGGYPWPESYALGPDAAIDRLDVPDPRSGGRMPEQLRAVRILRAEVGDEVPVVGAVLGPMTLAQQLMGPEKALYFAADEPRRFEALLDLATEVALRFGGAQLEAGAQLMMVFDPAASPEVVPPAFYRELLLPRAARLLRAFREAGALANWMHVAGPTEPILAYYADAGVDIANLDYPVDPGRARQILPDLCLLGNVRPLDFVLGSPDEVAAEGRRLVRLYGRHGGFILSSGCEIPPEAGPDHVAALVSAVHAE